eukprot:m.89998 g.89998  ORF g.89998 m.89998 type:complete len:319 (+) comp26354_c0_seq4:377-1333(+)
MASVFEMVGFAREADMIRGFPPELAGRLSVVLISFMAWFLLWLALSKRKVSKRVIEVVETKLQKKTGKVTSTSGVHAVTPTTGPSIGIEQVELATRVVGLLHAVIVSYGAWNYLRKRIQSGDDSFTSISHNILNVGAERSLNDPDMHEDFVFYLCVSVGFFIGDLILVLVLYEVYGWLFLFHACCGLTGFAWGMTRMLSANLSLKFTACAMLTEGSTPWLNLFFLIKVYLPSWSRLHLLVGLMMLVSFFVIRIVFVYSETYTLLAESYEAAETGVMTPLERNAMFIWTLGLDCLNCLWCCKMVGGFARKLMPKKAKTN